MQYYLLTISLTIFLFGCRDSESPTQVPADDQSPSVLITYPENHSTVYRTVKIKCVSVDDKGIQKLELWVDDEYTDSSCSVQPFEINWDTRIYADGSEHQVTVKAIDFSGNTSFSTPLQLITDNSNYPKIFFLARRHGWDTNIHVMNTDGSYELNLTNTEADDWRPNVSPDGTMVVFESYRDDNWEIYRMDIDGSDIRRLTNHSGFDRMPQFSTDGTKIAFNFYTSGGLDRMEIHIMDVDGQNRQGLTDNSGQDWLCGFSPIEEKILYISDRDSMDNIYTMNIDGSDQTNLTENYFNNTSPCYSPDGSTIVFISDRDENPEIYLMNSDGTEQTRLTFSPENEIDPKFSPDGNQILFLMGRDIFTMNRDGTNIRNLTNQSGWDRYMSPSYTPDGSKIIYWAYINFINDIYIMNNDGSNKTNLTNNIYEDWDPVVSGY